MKILALALLLFVLLPFAPAQNGGQGYSTYDTDTFAYQGAGGGTVGTLPLQVQSEGDLHIITRRDGRVGVNYGGGGAMSLLAPAHSGPPDASLTWKCRAGTMRRDCWKEPGEDSHAMDVRFANEVQQMQAIELFSPIE